MYSPYSPYSWPNFINMAMMCNTCPCHCCANNPMYNSEFSNQFNNRYIPFSNENEYDAESDFFHSERANSPMELKDYGPNPFVFNIDEVTKKNTNFRTAIWTGKHLQITLMSIPVGGEIGLENHPNLDQFIRIEEGEGIVKMGDRKDRLSFQSRFYDDFAIVIPAGKWHNLINTGKVPIKLYSIYAPPQHPFGTIHKTKAESDAAEKNHGH